MQQVLRGRYAIISLLGSGGFGKTFLAKDGDLPGHPTCVVKQLQPLSTAPAVLQEAERLFNAEAEVLYQLGNHDHIPRLLAHFEEDEQFYLVQEFVEGHDLSQEILPGQQWGEVKVVRFLEEVLQILGFVHQQNVIHRDIKPANLIRRKRDGRLFLIDFGAVKQIQTLTIDSRGQTNSTIAVGTPGYMPNEQQGGKPRFSSDIYALGMTAIQALTGVFPKELPEDPATGEIVWRQRTQISNGLAAILDKMVRSHFRDRYQSVGEVLSDLRNLNNSHTTVTSSTAVTSSPTTTRQQVTFQQPTASNVVSNSPRRWRFVIPALILLVLATSGGTFFLLRLFSSPVPVSQSTPTTTPQASPTNSATPLASAPTTPSPTPLASVPTSPSAIATPAVPTPSETPTASPTSSPQVQTSVALTDMKCLTTSADSGNQSFVKGAEDVTIGEEIVTAVAALRSGSNYISTNTPAGVACLIAPTDSSSQFHTLKLNFGVNNTNYNTGTATNSARVKLTAYLDKRNIGSKVVTRGQQQSWKINVTNVKDVALEAECLKAPGWSCPSIVFTQDDLQ